MLYQLKQKMVNWVDGMKISSEHLKQTEDYFIDVVRDATNMRLTEHNFGLLPPYRGEKLSSDFEITERISNHVEIELRRCNAITPGGCRITFNPVDSSDYLRLDYPFEQEVAATEGEDGNLYWDVILVVRPFDRIPLGAPDPEETPPRHPDAGKSYHLYIKPAGEINSEEFGMHHLLIGRVTKTADRYEVDSSYIPPCTSMGSHPDLKGYYEQFGKYFNDIEISSHKIIQKIHEQESKSSTIANNIKLVCEHLLTYTAAVYFNFRNTGRNYVPVEIINTFSSLAHTAFVSINFINKKQKEEMLQYFYEWSDITPGNLMAILTDMLEATYKHYDIRGMMDKTGHFLSEFSRLWIKLSTLEYIGQHKENVVVAQKTPKVEVVTRQSGWTIID
ncbi:MAG: type VI secretion system baseplate subunit TssK [Tannerella sp.]|nr:type VI secretion system baseplate subunit TssK [Tannerella sp.]